VSSELHMPKSPLCVIYSFLERFHNGITKLWEPIRILPFLSFDVSFNSIEQLLIHALWMSCHERISDDSERRIRPKWM
jgi:hypothetical protein